LAWQIKFDEDAQKDLAKLDKPVARRITKFLRERIAPLENPRSIGDALTGSRLGEFWRYRVGDYRIISRIEDEAVRILVVKIGNRGAVYKKK
jgi:mRNA interferase RelE/StbE